MPQNNILKTLIIKGCLLALCFNISACGSSSTSPATDTYEIVVTNAPVATVSISGSTTTNAINPNSETSFSFSANYGDNVSLIATKTGSFCSVTPASINPVTGNGSAAVSCSANSYTVSGTVSGLGSGKSVVLQNNSANNQTVASPSSTFSFPTQADLSGYSVTVLTQPVGQTCLVTNGSGTLAGANVTNVLVTCTNTTYTVSGSISGLTAGGLTLTLSGSQSSAVSPASRATSYSFTQTVVNGNSHTVSITSQPVGLSCTLSPNPATGTVGTSNIVVDVSCVVSNYTITVANSSAAAVSITGSTATNATNPNSATSFSFLAKHGDAVVLAATKIGNTCSVATTPSSINPITGNATATVNCLGSAVLSWSKPTLNDDGTTLIDLTGYVIYYGTSSDFDPLTTQIIAITGGNTTNTTINDLQPGATYYFAIASVSGRGGEGKKSNPASKTIN